MKTKTKALGLLMAVVLLVTATVFGTMAYLTDTQEVVNTFTVGSVAIKLDEADVKPDGTYETIHDSRVQSNSYKLMPGRTYFKDPTVTVLKGSESSYVRMLVTISKAEALKAACGGNFQFDEFFANWDEENWTLSGTVEDTEADTITCEFRYKEAVAASDSDVVLDDLFESFTVPGSVTGEQLAALKDMQITVVAHAIQADGFENATAAWNAFPAV